MGTKKRCSDCGFANRIKRLGSNKGELSGCWPSLQAANNEFSLEALPGGSLRRAITATQNSDSVSCCEDREDTISACLKVPIGLKDLADEAQFMGSGAANSSAAGNFGCQKLQRPLYLVCPPRSRALLILRSCEDSPFS